jgi:hypothetical protein
MLPNDDISGWQVPKWHPDFGDAARELELLKAVASRLVTHGTCLNVDLECYEEGYMNVNVLRGSVKIAEIHVVPADLDGRMLGLFFTDARPDSEWYFKEPDELVEKLTECS